MKIIYAGTPDFAAAALRSLHEAGHDIVLVLTQPDRPAGRGMQLQASAVKQYAQQHGMPVAQPVSLLVQTFGTSKLSEDRLVQIVRDTFDLRPKGLIAMLDLLKPIYQLTAAYGHFGRTEDSFSWEKTDKVDALKAAAGI